MTRSPSPSLISPQFLLLCVSVLFFFASYHLLSPVLPFFFKANQFQGQAIGTLMSAFMVASLVTRPWIGKLCDERNKKMILLVGVIGFMICPVLYLLTHDQTLLFGIRLLHGISFSLTYTSASSLLADIVPPDRKAEGISYFSNAIKVAMAFSPGLGLWLAERYPLAYPFVLSAIFSMLVLACVSLIPSASAAPKAASSTSARGKLFNRKAFFPGFLMATNSIAFGALIPFVPQLAQEKHLADAGLFYTLYALFLIFSRTLTGKLSDKYGRDSVLIPGMLMVVMTLLFLSWSPSLAVFLIAACLYGLSAGTVQPSLMALALDKADAHERGSTMATFTMFTDLGIACGMYVMGSLGSTQGYSASLLWIVLTAFMGWILLMVSQFRQKRLTSEKVTTHA